MHYRDSKYNIGLHKIGVKLFDRPFDRPVFEGCSYGSPNCEDKMVAGRSEGMSPQPDFEPPTGVGLTCTASQGMSFIGCKVVNPRSSAT